MCAIPTEVGFYSLESGKKLGTLSIYSDSPQDIALIDHQTALELGEEETQLLENTSYDFEIKAGSLSLETSRLVRTSKISAKDRIYGLLSTGNHVGLLRLFLLDNGKRVAEAKLEIRSRKIDYRSDYRSLLGDIASWSNDLLLQVTANTQARFSPQYNLDEQSAVQKFILVLGLMNTHELENSIQQIINHSHTRLLEIEEKISPTRGMRGDVAKALSQVGVGSRMPLPLQSPLTTIMAKHGVMKPSLPHFVDSRRYVESRDTRENRFVKHVLKSIDEFLGSVEEIVSASKRWHVMVSREVKPLRNRLEDLLSLPFFVGISNSMEIPGNSTVLQRKLGYREIYDLWLGFESTISLSWNGAENSVSGATRDLPTLYEYWTFFLIIDAVQEVVGKVDESCVESLFEMTLNGVSLKLKRGEISYYESNPVQINGIGFKLKIYYNRTFTQRSLPPINKRLNYEQSAGEAGSWTRQMRPDITLAIWPDNESEKVAIQNENIVLLHFDAKYSIEHLSELFAESEEEQTISKTNKDTHKYSRNDLLRMHTYKDAIKKSNGAYILYPGIGSKLPSSQYKLWMQYHEIIPGIGAFCVRPGDLREESCSVIADFLRDVLDYLSAKKVNNS